MTESKPREHGSTVTSTTTSGALGPARSIEEFRKDVFVGKGTYGSVWKVTRIASNKTYALKEVDMRSKKQSEREESVNEIRLLASAKHPNIIRYRDSFFDNDHLYIITDFADHGDLGQIIAEHKKAGTTIPENRVWSLFIQISLGLEYLHRRHILHRDLKSSNVFLKGEPEVAKIGDLGVAKLLKTASSTQTQVGTPFYISPEIWRKLPYNSKSDVWSLGCVLYEMCTLHHPFSANSPKELSQKILRGRYPPIHGYSHDIVAIIDQLLCVETTKRPSMQKLLTEPSIVRRMELLPSNCVPTSPVGSQTSVIQREAVLNTIKVPRNLTRLGSVLPPAAYMTPSSEQRDLNSIGAEIPKVPKLHLDLEDYPIEPPALNSDLELPPALPPAIADNEHSIPSIPALPLPPPLTTTTTTNESNTNNTNTESKKLSPASSIRERDRHNLAVQRIIAGAQKRRKSSMFVLPEALGSKDRDLARALHILPTSAERVSPPSSQPLQPTLPINALNQSTTTTTTATTTSVNLPPPAPVVRVSVQQSSQQQQQPIIRVKQSSSPKEKPATAKPVIKPTHSYALRDVSNVQQQPPPLPISEPHKHRQSIVPPAITTAKKSSPPATTSTNESSIPHYLRPRESDRRSSVAVKQQQPNSKITVSGCESSSSRLSIAPQQRPSVVSRPSISRRQSVTPPLWRP